MTSEYLLDQIGLLDDDLILDAETEYVSKSKAVRKQLTIWLPTAACIALLLFTVPMLNRGGEESAFAPAASDSAMSGTIGESEFSSSQAASSLPVQNSDGATDVSADTFIDVTIDGLHYSFCHHGDDAVLDTLPEGCRYLGQVEPYRDKGNGDKYYYLFNTIYSGCNLWLDGTGKDSTLYLEHPEGGYLVCEYSQTYPSSSSDRQD